MKKFSYVLILLFGFLFSVNSVFASDISCNFFEKKVKIDIKLPDTVHMIILVLQIAVPIILVIFGLIDFIKALTSQKDDEIKKGQKTFISRIIAGVLIFFVVAIVKFVIGVVAGDDSSDLINCADCFLSGRSSTGCQAAMKTN